jgi:hypothetical protein
MAPHKRQKIMQIKMNHAAAVGKVRAGASNPRSDASEEPGDPELPPPDTSQRASRRDMRRTSCTATLSNEPGNVLEKPLSTPNTDEIRRIQSIPNPKRKKSKPLQAGSDNLLSDASSLCPTLPNAQSTRGKRGLNSIDDAVTQNVARKARDMMEFITLMVCPFPDADDMVDNLREVWKAACNVLGEDYRSVKLTKAAAVFVGIPTQCTLFLTPLTR